MQQRRPVKRGGPGGGCGAGVAGRGEQAESGWYYSNDLTLDLTNATLDLGGSWVNKREHLCEQRDGEPGGQFQPIGNHCATGFDAFSFPPSLVLLPPLPTWWEILQQPNWPAFSIRREQWGLTAGGWWTIRGARWC